ncbi:MAG: SpoIIE family protein phosphatase [Gammaproteobacteria bacterium]|nr:SpoIIE family protein phosphatase [Gammaproteobacteria bacterium]
MNAQQPIQPASIRFKLDGMASLHSAVAMTRNLAFLQDLGLEERVLISTVVSELGTNIIKFAGKGELKLTRTLDQGHDAVEIVAEDRGSGIRDVEQAMQEGFSTAGTLGLGLTAVRRIMSRMQIETGERRGTKVVAVKWLDGQPRSGQFSSTRLQGSGLLQLEYAHRLRPYPGETRSGDSLVIQPLATGLLCGVIDVSGHGPEAADLADELAQVVTQAETDDLEELLKLLHERSRGTRGAAAGLAVINRASGRLTFAGLGNVHIRVLGANKWRGVSRDGILGERMRHFLPQSVALASGDLVVMASDGISESSRSSSLVRGSSLSATELCERLLEESGKRTDDASCVVVKCL